MSEYKSPIWHPYTQHAIAPEAIHIDRAAGAYLFARGKDNSDNPEDAPENERCIIDGVSSWWVISHGHCHPDIVRAVQNQAAACDQVIFAGFTHEPAEELAEKLINITDDHLSNIFFSDSGSTAVEVALKMAIGFWEHTGAPRRKIIAFEGGYHGDTFGTMSVGGRSIYHKLYQPYMFDVEYIPFPEEGKESSCFDALEKILKDNQDDIAAFIFEPLLQGAGGMRIYSPDVLKTISDMCRAQGILLIADEVMTGFGRTGTMFACEQASLIPDLLCLSKGLTGGFLSLGATLCSGAIYKAFYHKDKSKMFFHSSSFMGNPISCAAANASLDIWEREPVLERTEQIAKSHADAACQLSKRSDINNIRQKGTMLAMDIIVDDAGYLSNIQSELYSSLLSQDVLLRPLGNSLYILPPYCSTGDDLDKIYCAINKTLNDVLHRV